MKRILFGLFIFTVSSSFANAAFDFCDEYEDPNLHDCRELGPFDVTLQSFNIGLSMDTTPFDTGFDFGVHVSDRFYQFMQGMERYAEEMEEWIEYMEFREDQQYAQNMNSDLNDSVAYAVVERMEFKVEYDGKIRWYRHGDVIRVTDWDNNGKIDVFDINSYLDYSDATIK